MDKNIQLVDRNAAIFIVIIACLIIYTLPIWMSWIGIITEFNSKNSEFGERFVRRISKEQDGLGVLKKLILPLISALTIKSLWSNKNSNRGWILITFLIISLAALFLSVEFISTEEGRARLKAYDTYFTTNVEVELAIKNYLGEFLEGLSTLIVLVLFIENNSEQKEDDKT